MSPPRYNPDLYPPRSLDWAALLPRISRAHRAVAVSEDFLNRVPNPDVLLAPLSGQEAVLSSRIEGTRASLREVLAFSADDEPHTRTAAARDDAEEVLNYRLALLEAVTLMERLPLSGRLIRQAHAVLMSGVRGQPAAPGEYRRVQNWIGPPGSSEATATFVTCPAPEIPGAMTAWERYLHDETPDALVQLAVIHAWFEAIHPFLDGNGRIGRLIVPLFLVTAGLLTRPNFYLSEYLERHRESYFRHLRTIQSGGGWSSWLEFFLTALERQAIANTEKARQILDLHAARTEWVAGATRSPHAERSLDFLFQQPIFRTTDFVAGSGVPRPTAFRILRVLRDHGMLRELQPPRGRRPAVLSFSELIEIAESSSDFGDAPP